MAEDKPGLYRRDFLRVAGLTVGANFLAACRRAGGEPEKPTCRYDNGPEGWLDDAREYEVWKKLVGKENPYAEEGFSLVFVGGIYLPPELIHFRTTPSFERHYEVTGLITSSNPNFPDNNIISRNPKAGGVLVINPVVVEGQTRAHELSENSFLVPPPYGGKVENLKNIRHMWVAMATRPLIDAKVIGHNVMSRAELATGSAVTFANIAYDPMVFLIPPRVELGEHSVNYDGPGGFWRYAKLFRQYTQLGNQVDWVEPNKTAARWDGMAVLQPSKDLCIVNLGETRIVKDEAEARDIMAEQENPLRT